MKVAVVGVGHLGKEHARVWSEIRDAELVGVVDVDAGRAREVADRVGTEVLADLDAALAEVDAISVVTPTVHHHEVAGRCLEAGVHVLVEKPMTRTLEEADDLIERARESGCLLQVGHIERFNPALRAAREHLGHPRFIDCDRISPFSFRSADIGVVMDLMIHDLDIILDLVGDEVAGVDAIGVNVLGATEDLAHVRLEFAGGCVANITASRLALKNLRKIRVFQDDAYLSLDFADRAATLIRKREGFERGQLDLASLDPREIEDLHGHLFQNYLDLERLDMDEDEPLRLEIEAFRDAFRDDDEVAVPGEDARRAIALARRIVRQIRERLEDEVGDVEMPSP